MSGAREAARIKRLCASVVASFDPSDWTILQSTLPSGQAIAEGRVINCFYYEDDDVYPQVVASVLTELAKAGDGSLELLEDYLCDTTSSPTGEAAEVQLALSSGGGSPMVFISHKAEERVYAATLKEKLGLYGVDAFVAHEDIQVTAEWAVRIEEALSACDALAYIATPAANNSVWCQQEVGWAFGRSIPIVALAFGDNPVAFLGRRQAMRVSSAGDWAAAAERLVIAMMGDSRATVRTVDALIGGLASSTYFDRSNLIADALEYAPTISLAQASAIEEAIRENSQVSCASYGALPEKLRGIIANAAGGRAI